MIYKNYWRFSDTHAANTLMRLCLLRRQAESILTTFPYLRKHFPQALINWSFFDCHHKWFSLNEIRPGAKNFSNSQGKPVGRTGGVPRAATRGSHGGELTPIY